MKQHSSPPKLPLRFFRWYCHPDYQEDIEGDLLERFENRLNSKGFGAASRSFYKEVVQLFRPGIIRSLGNRRISNQYGMFKNYLKVALRNNARNKVFTLINTAGLALGMTCFLFIFLWVRDEKRIDNFHNNGKNLYNVYQKIFENGQVTGNYSTQVRYTGREKSIPLAEVKESIPEVEHVNFYATGYELPWGHPETFQVGEKIHKLEGSRASRDFFKMFSYPVVAGDESSALKDISSIAISKKMAELFFGTVENAVGKIIYYENQVDLTVNAVFDNVSSKSSLKFDYLVNWELHMKRPDSWASHNVLTTLQLAEGADVSRVVDKLNRFMQKHKEEDELFEIELGLQPFGERYLISNFVNGEPLRGRIEYINIFSGVAVFILVIACINFMNLSTARAVKRAREIGVRKTVGSSQGSLVGQFLGESMLLSFAALLSSLLLVQIFLPGFNAITGKDLALPVTDPSAWAVLTGLMLLTGFLAGSYPAFFLASIKPVQVLKGTLRFTSSTRWFRKGLTVFQFSLSILLLIVTLVVSRQTNYIQYSHLGYDRENLVYVRVEGELKKQEKYNLFKNEASRLPGVALVDRSSETPHAMGFVISDPIDWQGKGESDYVAFKPSSVGFDFVKLMNLEIIEGRDFSRSITSDSSDAFLVNEEALRQMGMKDPLGKWVSAWNKKGQIIGVLKDFHTHSLHEPIKPLIIDVKEYEEFGVIIIRTAPGRTREALVSLEKVYRDVNPNYPFDYQFIDLEYQKLYKSEQVTARLSNIFALLAMVVSCLGLLGLTIFSTEQRVKEISIRKVMGAPVESIVGLFSRDFLRLVQWSFFIAAPVSWWLMKGMVGKLCLSYSTFMVDLRPGRFPCFWPRIPHHQPAIL